MKQYIIVKGYIKTFNGKHYVKEDSFDMELHDFMDYITTKYIARGNKLAALPIKFINEISRVDAEKKREIEEILKR